MRHEANKAVYQTNFYPRPLRRGRRQPAETAAGRSWISIHALFAEGDDWSLRCNGKSAISIHALFAEGDPKAAKAYSRYSGFLSTPSSQRATAAWENNFLGIQISIHALFAEGDAARVSNPPAQLDFYPRPLRRGRPV